MKKEDPWFFEMRAECFASLVLTKHNNVKVLPYAARDRAIDLLVEFLKKGKSTLRFFGVQLVSYMDLPDMQTLDGKAFSDNLKQAPLEAALPICVFVIGVQKPDGIYRWSVEPAVEDGRALLRRKVDATWQPLDDAGAERLIGQVKAYYDALNGAPSPKKRPRRSKSAE